MSSVSNPFFFSQKNSKLLDQLLNFKWENTSFGHYEQWSDELRNQINTVLNHPLPNCLIYGTENSVFYNESFSSLLSPNPELIGYGCDFTTLFKEKIDFAIIEQELDKNKSYTMRGIPIEILSLNQITHVKYDFIFTNLTINNLLEHTILLTCIESTAVSGNVSDDFHFQKTVMQAPVAICIIRGPDHIVAMANEHFFKLVGKESTNVMGLPLFKFLPQIEKIVSTSLQDVLQTGLPYIGTEVPIPLNRSGHLKICYLDFLYYPSKDLEGNIDGVIVTLTDVSEKVAARKKIEENEHRLNLIVHASDLGFWDSNLVTKTFDFSTRFQEIVTGTSTAKNLTYEKFIDQIFEDDKIVREEAYQSAMISGNLKYVVRVQWYDKSMHWVEIKGKIIYDNQNTPHKLLGIARDVTNEKNFQNQLVDSEQRYRNLIIESPVPITILKGPDMVITTANRALLTDIWRRKESDVIGKKLFKVFPDLLNQKYAALLKQVYHTGAVHTETESLLTVTGNNRTYKRYIDFDFSPLIEDSNVITGVKVTLIDVTERVLARKKVEESEERFRLLTENIPQLIWETDAVGNLLYMSNKWREYTGQKHLGIESWLKSLHPADFQQHQKLWIRSLETGEPYKGDFRILSKSGHYRWHNVTGEPIRNDENVILKWVGSYTDIHTEKAFSQELEQQVYSRTKELNTLNETLQKSEERYHLMVNEVQDYAIIFLDENGVVQNWNVGAQKIKGYSAEEIVGRYFSVFYTQNDKIDRLPEKLLNQAALKGKVVRQGWRVKKDQSLFWANVVITAVHNKNREVIGFSKVTHDLTDKKQKEDQLKLNAIELQEKNIELEKMNKELQSFTYISSHDLQEPLRKIQTFASQIIEQESGNLSAIGSAKLVKMQDAANRMQVLINDLLTYSKTNSKERVFILTDISDLLDEVKEDLRENLIAKNAEVICLSKCTIPVIPFQFRQLLFNLVSNSIKFSQPEIPLKIQMSCQIDNGKNLSGHPFNPLYNYYKLTFSDNGIGFEQQYSTKIFEVFQRLHRKEAYQGTGIGLAIVKKIVDNHHGFVSATGNLNKGATFNIYIPVNQASDSN